MRAEIEINYRGKWINLDVDYEYGVSHDIAMVDCVMAGVVDITDVMDELDMAHLNRLAQKHHDHMKEIHRVNREARIARERQAHLAEVREEALAGDLVARARRDW